MSETAIPTLASTSLTLTPNLPLAQQLRRARLLEQQCVAAPSAPIQPLLQWLTNSLQAPLPMASESQQQLIWEQIIARHRDRDEQFRQLNPGVLAGHALTAWQSLKRWEIPPDELRKAETGQLICFSDWAEEFEKQLDRLGLTTPELSVLDSLATGNITKAVTVQLYAFITPPPPLWQRWLAANFEHVEVQDYQVKSCQAKIAALDNPQSELDAALQWADSLLQQDPLSRVAIIDFNLGDNLKPAQRMMHSRVGANVPKHLARELPLAKQGPVQTALALLQLNTNEIDLPTARLLTQSRLWGDFDQEYDVRAQWDRNLCALKQKTIGVSRFLDCIDHPPLQDFLSRPFADKRQIKRLPPLDHAARFQRQLDALGVFQVTAQFGWDKWEKVLDEFSALGHITGEIDIAQALKLLNRCASKPGAQSCPDGTGLYLLDTVEAAADFSHLWIMGMNSQNWPGAPQPNPLLPVSLQSRYQMPHVNADQEAHLAERLIQRLQQAATETIFSYSRRQDDLEQTPCALIADLPVFAPDESEPSSFQTAAMEWLDCSQAPPVPEEERTISGYDGSGSVLLQTMQASPFSAFAQWRLKAVPLEEPQIGLSAADRGTLVHRVLDQVWKQLESSAGLQAQQDEEARELCQEHARKVLSPFLHRFGYNYIKLETDRLASLVYDWLQLERQRPEFSLEFAEQRIQAKIGPLRFAMKLDRLDRLPGGELILIDYKTGNNLSSADWLDMPPQEPQLPLYALSIDTAPDVICFAQVRPDKMRFIGIGREELIEGVSVQENWPGLLDQWKSSLEELAQKYADGDARVFETEVGFGRTDALAPLHRFAEKDQLDLWLAERSESS